MEHEEGMAAPGRKIKVRIKEHSLIARLAAGRLGYRTAAIVIGRTIYLHNATSAQFLSSSRWVRHELKHVDQFRQHGFFGFLWKYLWESLRKGYRRNRFELEACEAEQDESLTAIYDPD